MSEQKTTRKYVHSLKIIPHRPDDEPLVCLKINVYWLAFLIAAIYPSRYPEAWEGTLDENKQARKDVLRLLEIILAEAGCNEVDCCVEIQIINRVNVQTGRIEISIDGGDTWRPSPRDPITQILEPAPPVTSGVSANKCDCATNGRQHFEDWVAHVSDAFDVAVGVVEFIIIVAAAVANALLIFLTGGGITAFESLIIELIGGVCAAVWAAGKTTWSEYWTSDNVDVVMCAMFCNISDDGSFTDAGQLGFMTDLRNHLPSSVAKELAIGMFSSIGKQGINKWVSYGSAANSDCSSCDCGTCDRDNWQLIDVSHGENRVTGNDEFGDYIQVDATIQTNNNWYAILQTPTINDCCEWIHSRIMSGDQSAQGFLIHCSVAREDQNYVNYGTTQDHCCHTAQYQAANAFTVRFYFTDC